MTKKIVINREFGDSFTLTYQPEWTLDVQDEILLQAKDKPSKEPDDVDALLSGWLKRPRRLRAPATGVNAKQQQTLDHDALAAEELIFEWCVEEARFSRAARILAAVYVAAAGGPGHRIRLSDLRTLNPEQRAWALTLINAYVDGRIALAWERAKELADLYELSEED